MSKPRNSSMAPTGLGDVIGRALVALVVSFVALQTKEFADSGQLDVAGVGIDAAVIAAGTFIVYAVLAFATGSSRRAAPTAILLALSAAFAASCTAAQGSAADSPQSSAPAATPASPQAATGAVTEPFDASTFAESSEVTNKFLPLSPGTRFTYEGSTVEDDGTVVPHRVIINVTDLTKVIGGVRSVVTWDLDYSDGELVEAELAFLAQDKDGRVWRMGEYPEEYEDGKFLAAPAWIHGFEDARAGIMMPANPQPGTPSYSQGWGPKVDWTDRGKVDQVGQAVTVRAGTYSDVLVVAESSASEGNAEQLKYYAPGIGNVKVGWRGSQEKTKETLELVRVEKLDAKAMAEVRASAMKMEKDAYTRSKTVYGPTTPMEPRPAAATVATR